MRNDSSRGLQEGGKLTYKVHVEGLALLKKASYSGNMKKKWFSDAISASFMYRYVFINILKRIKRLRHRPKAMWKMPPFDKMSHSHVIS